MFSNLKVGDTVTACTINNKKKIDHKATVTKIVSNIIELEVINNNITFKFDAMTGKQLAVSEFWLEQ